MPSDLQKKILYQLILQMAQRPQYQNRFHKKLMSLPRIFKGQKGDFQIRLALNNTNILEIQAVSPKESFAFAIDRIYLLEHSQFANLIREPVQILQFFEKSFQKVTFSEGRLAFPYVGVNSITRNVSILLFRDRALQILQQKLAEQQARIVDLIKNNNEKANIRFEQLQKTNRQMEGTIQSLITKTEDLQRQINQVRQNCQGGGIPVFDPAKEYKIVAASRPQQGMDINLYPPHQWNIIMWQYAPQSNRKWKFEQNQGEYVIVSLYQGRVLEIPLKPIQNEDQVRAGSRKNNINQRWRVKRSNNGFSIISVLNGKALRGFADFGNGSRVAAQSSFVGNQFDTWQIIEV